MKKENVHIAIETHFTHATGWTASVFGHQVVEGYGSKYEAMIDAISYVREAVYSRRTSSSVGLPNPVTMYRIGHTSTDGKAIYAVNSGTMKTMQFDDKTEAEAAAKELYGDRCFVEPVL